VEKILCISHGGLITEILNVILGLQGFEPATKDRIKNCSIYVFKVDTNDEGKLSIEALIENEVSHLDE
jgi:broad specificity phosphatase PhoE